MRNSLFEIIFFTHLVSNNDFIFWSKLQKVVRRHPRKNLNK